MANATTTRIDSDLDAQSPAADLVRVYLNCIGKTALLSAEDEVELAKRIEAGLYAQHLLQTRKRLGENRKRDLSIIVRDGQAARRHLLEANLRLVVSLAKRYTGRGMPLLDIIDRLTARPAAILGLEVGRLSVGAWADLVVFEPDRAVRIDASKFLSKSKNSPFDGKPAQGRVWRTVYRGRTVFDLDTEASGPRSRRESAHA